jgi:hypothetical protein
VERPRPIRGPLLPTASGTRATGPLEGKGICKETDRRTYVLHLAQQTPVARPSRSRHYRQLGYFTILHFLEIGLVFPEFHFNFESCGYPGPSSRILSHAGNQARAHGYRVMRVTRPEL